MIFSFLVLFFVYLFVWVVWLAGFDFSIQGFLCVVLTVLELTLQTKLASNSEICLPLPPELFMASLERLHTPQHGCSYFTLV